MLKVTLDSLKENLDILVNANLPYGHHSRPMVHETDTEPHGM